jgi:hypothetical protein
MNTFRLKLKHMLIGHELNSTIGGHSPSISAGDMYSDVLEDIEEIGSAK